MTDLYLVPYLEILGLLFAFGGLYYVQKSGHGDVRGVSTSRDTACRGRLSWRALIALRMPRSTWLLTNL
jgi:hypothetical protein